MRGVTFDKKHSYWEWGLMLKTAPEITSPEPKTYYVDILGAHGKMDLTEALSGKVQYNNRQIKLEFISMAGREEWSAIYSAILDEVHGKVKEIMLDDDMTHVYKGRVTVGDPVWYKECVTLPMTVEAEPFKKSIDGSVRM